MAKILIKIGGEGKLCKECKHQVYIKHGKYFVCNIFWTDTPLKQSRSNSKLRCVECLESEVKFGKART